MDLQLKGKNVLVTGGSKNIGKGIVEIYLEEGANVVFTYHSNQAQAEATYRELLPKAQGHLSYCKANAGDIDDCNRTFDYCYKVMGPLDILVNNAASTGAKLSKITEMTDAFWQDQMQNTLTSVFYHCRHMVADCIRDNRHAHIVNVCSKASLSTITAGREAYSAAKAGVYMFTRNLAGEVAPYGIIVNGIMPGFILEGSRSGQSNDPRLAQISKSNVGPLGYPGEPRDLAQMAVFLSSQAATFAVGTVVDMTGGRLL